MSNVIKMPGNITSQEMFKVLMDRNDIADAICIVKKDDGTFEGHSLTLNTDFICRSAVVAADLANQAIHGALK